MAAMCYYGTACTCTFLFIVWHYLCAITMGAPHLRIDTAETKNENHENRERDTKIFSATIWYCLLRALGALGTIRIEIQ